MSITDTVISNNWARINGGIYSDQSTLSLHRCEISGNEDTGIYLFEGSGAFSQCLIEANTFAGIAMSRGHHPQPQRHQNHRQFDRR